MIGTANGYYDVVMEYKQPLGTGVAQGAKLSWQAASLSKTPITNDKLYQRHCTKASPFSITVRSSLMCSSTSSISNLVLSQQAPFSAIFTITARDEYENLLDGTLANIPVWAKSVSILAPSTFYDTTRSHLPVVSSSSSSEFLLPVSITVSG